MEYPKTLYASALLEDNGIIKWNIGKHSYYDRYYLKDRPNYKIVEKEFIVTSEEEAKEVFSKLGADFLSQYKLHPDFAGYKPKHEDEVQYFSPQHGLFSVSKKEQIFFNKIILACSKPPIKYTLIKELNNLLNEYNNTTHKDIQWRLIFGHLNNIVSKTYSAAAINDFVFNRLNGILSTNTNNPMQKYVYCFITLISILELKEIAYYDEKISNELIKNKK